MRRHLSHVRGDSWRRNKLIWAVPTLLLSVAIDIDLQAGTPFPIPFILLLISVSVAGTFGSLWTGLAAGLIAAFEVLQVYSVGLGQEGFTEGLFQASWGALFFALAGVLFGWSKNRYDTTVAELQKTKGKLEETSIERNQKAAKVSERDDQLRHAMRLSGLGFFKWNTQTGDCEYCSEQHAAHFGLSQQEYQYITRGPEPYTGFVHSDDKQSFLDSIARVNEGEALPFDYRILRPDGQIRYIRQINEPIFDDAGVGIAVVGSSLDFTDLHETEERLCQSQRIETIGNLTGGVAHDFNNLLAVILGNLELALEIDGSEAKAELIQEAIKATNRGTNLTKSLLSFARRAHLTPERVNLNDLVNTTVIWSSRILPETISIETSLSTGLWDTELDADSAEHAIVNLLLNARDAMTSGGRLTLETTNIVIGREDITDWKEDLEPGRYVMLAISDTGHGIAKDKFDQIFEPFYTDKPVGSGTGLGLSMVHGFISQSNGAIHVFSEENEGTTFKMYFKAFEGTVTSVVPTSPEAKPLPKEGLRILLAEDEEGVARIIQSTLENAGHSVVYGSNGEEAFKLFKSAGPFDILLTDVVMPGSYQGPALAEAIRAIEPNMPCVFLSGYAAEATVHGKWLKPPDVHLMKPASREQLLNAVAGAGKK